MKLLLDSFWRAIAYLLLPRVIGLSMLPLLLAGGAALGLGWLFWTDALTAVRGALEQWSLIDAMLKWLENTLGAPFRVMLAPVIVVALAVPVIVVVSLLLVAWLMTPAIVSAVHERRFPGLERRHGAAAWRGVVWSLGCTAQALLALMVTMPLWLIPPLVLVVPPLIWGWLTKQVMGFDVLADHATTEERRAIVAEHRWQLLLIGVVTGYLGAAPSLIWAISAATLIFAPLLIVASVWLYTLVFAFSALWFAHYALAALHARRQVESMAEKPVEVVDALDSASAPGAELPPVLPPS
jgi:hypothetical protein